MDSHGGHFNLVCPRCNKRVGGCRCASPDKSIVADSKLCDDCIKAANDAAKESQ